LELSRQETGVRGRRRFCARGTRKGRRVSQLAAADRRALPALETMDPEGLTHTGLDHAVFGATWGLAYWVLTRKRS
jgi:hypothetical protein